MGTVHYLDGRGDVISMLEKHLALAKEGKILAVAIAAQVDDDSIATSWGILPNKGNVWTLIGAIAELHWRVMNGANGMVEKKFTPPAG